MFERDSAPSPERRIRVVLADDNEPVRNLVARLLPRRGPIDVVAACGDGREAIQVCTELAPDVALLDLRMPLVNGIDAIASIHAQNPAIRIVILSGSATPRDVEAALAAGAAGFVLKQADLGELLAAVHAVTSGTTFVSVHA